MFGRRARPIDGGRRTTCRVDRRRGEQRSAKNEKGNVKESENAPLNNTSSNSSVHNASPSLPFLFLLPLASTSVPGVPLSLALPLAGVSPPLPLFLGVPRPGVAGEGEDGAAEALLRREDARRAEEGGAVTLEEAEMVVVW
jgi:hypothetical protein